MSNPTMNHNSHSQEVADQQQQQQQITRARSSPNLEPFNQVSLSTNSNLDMPTSTTLTRSDSTSTVILEEEEKRTPLQRRKDLLTLPPSAWANISLSLRSLLKTSGLFNEKSDSFDKLNDLFASGNQFTLQRLLSEMGNEIPLDMNDLIKLDSVKMLDSRTLSDFIRSESFDQLLATAIQNNDISSTPHALPCSSSSFSELRPVSPELFTPDMFAGQNKMDTTDPMIYTHMTSAESANVSNEMNQTTLNAVEHDHAFLYKRMPAEDESTSSSSSAVVKANRRTITTGASRNQNRPTSSLNKSKRSRNINRATDIQSSDDLSYYLERRRKNNEASKVSRAVRKQRFDEMDTKCAEYERVNDELRKKISTLETVTKNLKSGLITNFQRK